jgi:hypothetical protein
MSTPKIELETVTSWRETWMETETGRILELVGYGQPPSSPWTPEKLRTEVLPLAEAVANAELERVFAARAFHERRGRFRARVVLVGVVLFVVAVAFLLSHR